MTVGIGLVPGSSLSNPGETQWDDFNVAP